MCVLSRFSRVQLSVTPQTGAHQAPQSMGFSRQEYWSGLPCPPPGDPPDPEIEPASLEFPALAGGSFTTRTTSYCRCYHEGKPGEGYVGMLRYLCNFCASNDLKLSSYINNNQPQFQ